MPESRRLRPGQGHRIFGDTAEDEGGGLLLLRGDRGAEDHSAGQPRLRAQAVLARPAIFIRKKVNKIELPEELLKEDVDNLLSGLENRKVQQVTLDRYIDKKLQVAKDLHKVHLDEHIIPHMNKPDIAGIIHKTVKENATGTTRKAMQQRQRNEEDAEEETLMDENVGIAMEKLRERVYEYIDSGNPMRLLGIVDETHVESERVEIAGFLAEPADEEPPVSEENEGNIDPAANQLPQ